MSMTAANKIPGNLDSENMGLRKWVKSGAPWVWLNAAAVSVSLLLVIGLLSLIAVRGMGHFWPAAVYEMVYEDHQGQRSRLAGQVSQREEIKAERLRESGIPLAPEVEMVERILLKIGNRELGGEDFRWILEPGILQQTKPNYQLLSYSQLHLLFHLMCYTQPLMHYNKLAQCQQ